MTTKKIYMGSFGPFQYEDDDALYDPDGDFFPTDQHAITTDGSILVGGIALLDTDESNTLTFVWNEDDTANRTLNFLVGGGDRSLTLNEDLTIGDGTAITITGVTQANTLTLYESFTIGDGNSGTLVFGAASKTLTVSQTLTLTGASGKTLTFHENFTISDGNGITITGTGQANTLTMNESFTIGDGNSGTLTYSAASKTLTVEDTAIVSQDYSSDSTTVSLAGLALTGNLALAANSITGTSVDISNAELQLLSAITATGGTLIAAANDAAALAILSGDATATFDWNTQNLTGLGTLTSASGTLTIDETVALSGKANVSHAMSTHSDEDTYNIATSGSILTSGTGGVTTGSASNLGKLVIYDGSDHKITVTSPSISADWQLTLPPNDGDTGNVLTTDGDGICTWTAAGAGDVTAAAVMADHTIVRGDGGAKGIQDSGVTLDDSDNLSGVGTVGCGTVTSSGNVVIADAGNIGSASDTDAMAITAAGILTFSGQSTCAARLVANQTIPTGAWVKLALSTEYWDIQNEFDNTYVTGSADATEADKLHDVDGGFTAEMVGASIWNTTDNTYALVSGFVDDGELDLSDDIMANGEGYVIYWARFTTTVAGRYVITGAGYIDDLLDSNLFSLGFKKNGSFYGNYNTARSGAAGGLGLAVAASFDLVADDYIEICVLHGAGANKSAIASDYSSQIQITKVG